MKIYYINGKPIEVTPDQEEDFLKEAKEKNLKVNLQPHESEAPKNIKSSKSKQKSKEEVLKVKMKDVTYDLIKRL